MRTTEQHFRKEYIAAAIQQIVHNQIIVSKVRDNGIGRHLKAESGTIGNERHLFSLDVVDRVAAAGLVFVGIF